MKAYLLKESLDRLWNYRYEGAMLRYLPIPMKVFSDSDWIPVTGSEVKLIVFGAKRRWRSYRA
jgi:hypothetical protein